MSMSMNNSDYVEIVYNGPKAEKPIYGIQTQTFYGYHGNGDRFLVLREDAIRTPEFTPVPQQVAPTPMPQKAPPSPPPPPRSITAPAPPAPVAAPEKLEEVIRDKAFDVQSVPGVTPAVAVKLMQAGLNSPTTILEAGVEGLLALKGIGDKRAELIHGYVTDNYADTPADSSD